MRKLSTTDVINEKNMIPLDPLIYHVISKKGMIPLGSSDLSYNQ